MKGFILAFICILIFALPLLAQDESVLSHYGTLKIGGILQTTFTYNMDEDDIQTAFALKRARLLFWGTIVPDKVKYFIQTEAAQATDRIVQTTVVVTPYLLDTKLIFADYIPMTTITIGRFLPNFTHYMPRSTAMLDMINYPLMVGNYAMWRQVGVQTMTKTDYVDFNVGLFNGYPKNNWTDNNDAKDLLLAAAGKPAEFVKLFGYGWFGNLLLADDEDLAKNRYGFGALIDYPLSEEMSVAFKGEYCLGIDEQGEGIDDVNSAGYYAHLGFKVKPQIELLLRYDNFDPDTDTDDDAETWITLGANYFLDGDHVKFSLNYIIKMEEVDEYDNDQIVAQAQLFF